MTVTVRFVGSGDAFGSGGRLQAAIFVDAGDVRFLIDCGASSLVGLKRLGIDPARIDAILVSHFHGDHFGGLPFFLLDAQFFSKRERLLVVGPPGVRDAVGRAQEALFPGSRATPAYEVEYREAAPGIEVRALGLTVAYVAVDHTPGTAAHALRVSAGGRTIAYTGDTAWCDAVEEVAEGADLLIAECYGWDRAIPKHLDHATLVANRARLRARRVVVTHLGPAALAREREAAFEVARDGMEVAL
ncbi:MAG TPA: MBL fold metallo-hydrolase [Candidatus Limnocylindria bacterium]|nr:MBL fold metallo-hydrolase [Candidatus Limnocylindria bacterium]